VEHDDGLGDDEELSPPLHPDDRLWRHPSELRDHPLTGADPPDRAAQVIDSRAWQLAAVGGLIGALLATGLLALATPLRVRTREIRTEREVAIPVPLATGAGLIETMDRVRRNVVKVKVDTSRGEVAASGVVFRSDGYIITNQHLVDGARSVTVTLADGQLTTATVVGGDSETDVAILHVDRSNLAVAPFAADPPPRVGDVSMAVGTSVSLGIISTLGGVVTQDRGLTLLDLIQTDAPISLTSTGGALVDVRGNVVGIVDVIPGGTGYAIPVDTARSVATQVIATGRVVWAWLGIEGTDVDGQTAKALGVDGGALVRDVLTGSPAAEAGIGPRDVITSVDGSSIGSMNSLKVLLRTRAPGTVIGVTVVRDGKERRTQATLKPRPIRAA